MTCTSLQLNRRLPTPCSHPSISSAVCSGVQLLTRLQDRKAAVEKECNRLPPAPKGKDMFHLCRGFERAFSHVVEVCCISPTCAHLAVQVSAWRARWKRPLLQHSSMHLHGVCPVHADPACALCKPRKPTQPPGHTRSEVFWGAVYGLRGYHQAGLPARRAPGRCGRPASGAALQAVKCKRCEPLNAFLQLTATERTQLARALMQPGSRQGGPRAPHTVIQRL